MIETIHLKESGACLILVTFSLVIFGTQTAANSNNFTNSQGTYIAEWQIVGDLISITFQGQTPTTGWVGFGINGKDQMPEGDVVVGWIDPNTNQVVLTDRIAQQRAMPQLDTVVGGTNDILNFTGRNEQRNGQNWMIFSYTRKLNTGDPNDFVLEPNKTTFLMWSLGPTNGVNYNTQTFSQHIARGTALVNFFGGCVPPPSRRGDTMRRVHAILMIIGWTILLNTGIYVARYMKRAIKQWFAIHVVYQSVGVAAILVGFIIIYVELRSQVLGVHHLFGLVVFILTECQPFMGLLADRLFDPKRKKVPVFPDQVHWWIGRVVMVLAVVTIFLGINQFIPNVYVAFILYGVYVGFCLAILIASEIKVGQVHEGEVFELREEKENQKHEDRKENVHKSSTQAKILYIVFLLGSVVIITVLLVFVGISTSQYSPTIPPGTQICNFATD